MSEDTKKLKYGVIPAGTRIKLYEAPLILQQNTEVNASQAFIDKALKDEQDFYNGIGVVGEHPVDKLVQGALSSMTISNAISGSGLKILPAPARIEIVDNLVSELQKLSDDIAVESPQASALTVLDVGAFLLKLLQQR